jgi:class 3 adenylate cyclase
MANLETIKALNLRYKKDSPIIKSNADAGLENFSLQERYGTDRIEKAYSNAFAQMGPNYTKYFDEGLPAELALLYVDICSFSTRFSDLSGKEIGKFFDEYYDLVIPIIYENHGEIDKVMGDGIICSFGPPFYNSGIYTSIFSANKCAEKIIKATADTRFESKVAVHAGTINYFKNRSGFYNEYTMIGKPLTELYRLESISEGNTINFYDDTPVANQHILSIILQDLEEYNRTKPTGKWKYVKAPVKNLKGSHLKTFIKCRRGNGTKRHSFRNHGRCSRR